jgi:hypothetical protein
VPQWGWAASKADRRLLAVIPTGPFVIRSRQSSQVTYLIASLFPPE